MNKSVFAKSRVTGLAGALLLAAGVGAVVDDHGRPSQRAEGPQLTYRSAGIFDFRRPGWFKKKETEEEIENTPASELFNAGLGHMNNNSYKQAIFKFNEVQRLHPYSELARKALILSAFSAYRMGEWDDTIAAGSRYLTLYPGADDAAYAQYLIAESYFKQIPTVDRDQRGAERALKEMTELVEKYPESEYAADAREKIIIARDQLAGKEMEVGRYYQKRGNYLGALGRYRVVVTSYQTTRHIEEALYRLTETYMALGVVSEAQTAAAVLGHNFPSSEWYKDSFQLLQTGGVRPSENTDSWISQLFRKAAKAL